MPTLPRLLTARDLTLLTVGCVIGSGIYLVPAVVLKYTGGSVPLALLVWLVAGVLSLLGALTYSELGAMQPEAGGLYVFIRDAFGNLAAFLYGWALFFVIGSAAVATLSVAFTAYLRQFVPIGPTAGKAVSVMMIVVLAIINVRGTRGSANVMNWTTSFKVGALFVLSVYLLFAGGHLSEATHAAGPAAANMMSGLLTAMIGVLWAYEGWQFVTFLAGEARDPHRTLPRGLIAGTIILIVLYCLASTAYVAALGPARAIASERIAADAVVAKLGVTAGWLITIPILVSIFSAANSITLTSPRVFFAMARDGIFFSRLAEVHPRFGTPAAAVVTMSGVAIVLAVSGTFEQLLTYVVFTGWIFYALGACCVFKYRRDRPDATRPFRVPGYPLTPLLFVVSAALIVVNTVVTQPGRALVGMAIVLAGLPAYWLWRRGAMSLDKS